MAVIDLSGANVIPWEYSIVFAAGDTWQEITLPEWCRTLVIAPEAVVGYVAGKGAGDPGSPTAPVDGGAVGAHRTKIPADSALEWVRGISAQVLDPVFVAVGAAGTLTLHLEG